MGADRNERKSKSGGSGSGSVNPGERAFGVGTRAGTAARFSDIEDLGTIIDGLVGTGDALMFARTSDGGALSITLLRGKGREKVYPATKEALSEVVEWLREEYLGG